MSQNEINRDHPYLRYYALIYYTEKETNIIDASSLFSVLFTLWTEVVKIFTSNRNIIH